MAESEEELKSLLMKVKEESEKADLKLNIQLEKEIATHSSVLAWRIPGTGEPGGLPSTGSHRVRHDWSDAAAAAAVFTGGEGNGNPLQCSCIENPRDGGAWWAAVYGVTQSRTRLKWLSSSSNSKFCTLSWWQWVKDFMQKKDKNLSCI